MPDFWKTAARLEEHYGRPSPPPARDPFALVLYENVAYLVSDDRRERAFRELKKRVGLRPADVLTAPIGTLTEITALGGIFADLRARRLQESARLVRDEFGGNLRGVFSADRGAPVIEASRPGIMPAIVSALPGLSAAENVPFGGRLMGPDYSFGRSPGEPTPANSPASSGTSRSSCSLGV
jgi:hypothetical protein